MKFCSIILCHYSQVNPGKEESRSVLLKQTIDSLLKNTDYPAELIVMDNGGSPDDSEYFLTLARAKKITTYIRFADNMSFAYAWNTGARVATGDYIAFICNDIYFKEGWLSKCIELLEKHSDRKLIAAPFITPDKDAPKWNKEVLDDGSRINTLAGSNCMVLRKGTFQEVGEFPHHRIGGSSWHRAMNGRGYLVIIPPSDYAVHLAWRKGVQWRNHIKVEKTLLNEAKISFDYVPYKKSLYYGSQRFSGPSLSERGETEGMVFPWNRQKTT